MYTSPPCPSLPSLSLPSYIPEFTAPPSPEHSMPWGMSGPMLPATWVALVKRFTLCLAPTTATSRGPSFVHFASPCPDVPVAEPYPLLWRR